MRRQVVAILVLLISIASPATAELTSLERQRLIAHMDMTASWLADEVSGLSPAQLAFRRAPRTWSILEVLEHLVVVAPIYWDDLQKAVKAPPARLDLASSDADTLWYGIDRTHRESALVSEGAPGKLRDVGAALAEYRKHHARLLEYVKTTKDDLRSHLVPRQGSDAYQWALLISTHEQRHILQIREIKADPNFPAR